MTHSHTKSLKPVLLFPLKCIAHTITRISAKIRLQEKAKQGGYSAESNNLAIVKTLAEIRIETVQFYSRCAHRKNLYCSSQIVLQHSNKNSQINDELLDIKVSGACNGFLPQHYRKIVN